MAKADRSTSPLARQVVNVAPMSWWSRRTRLTAATVVGATVLLRRGDIPFAVRTSTT